MGDVGLRCVAFGPAQHLRNPVLMVDVGEGTLPAGAHVPRAPEGYGLACARLALRSAYCKTPLAGHSRITWLAVWVASYQ